MKDSMDTENKKTAASRYEQLRPERDMFLIRAREAARLTLPSLVPPEGHNGSNDLYKPYQSLGSRGVNNLSAKLLMTLFPPNTPFQRFVIDDMELAKNLEANKDFKTEVDEALAKSERAIQSEIEATGIRASAFETIKLLVVSGNCLTYEPPTGGMRAYHLSQYVVLRDTSGNLLEIVLREKVAPEALPEKYREYVEAAAAKDKVKGSATHKDLDLYTWMVLEKGHWKVHQEVCHCVIQETEGTYPKEVYPWQALRWSKIQGENYGRGHVEELSGDLQSLEGLTQAIVEGSAAAAKLLFLVNPNGSTTAKNVSKAPNGGFIEGNRDDVTVLQLDKYADFRVSLETITKIEGRLEKAFLLNSSVQRSGERVTAEEIRYMASELETALGGVYAVLALEFQLPLVKALVARLQKQKKLPKFPNSVRPLIVTGLEALGRNNDLQKLDDFVKEMAQILGPDVLRKYLQIGEYLKRRATALSIDTKNLITTDEEVAAQDQQEQQAAAMQHVAPQFIKAAGDMAKTSTQVSAQAAQATP